MGEARRAKAKELQTNTTNVLLLLYTGGTLLYFDLLARTLRETIKKFFHCRMMQLVLICSLISFIITKIFYITVNSGQSDVQIAI